jgi:hypothetical protein
MVVRDLFLRIDVCEEESRTLTALRDAVLPKLTSGEQRISMARQDLEAEPA